MKHDSKRAGFTMVESILTAALFFGILGAFSQTIRSSMKTKQGSEMDFELSTDGMSALEEIRTDIARSGFADGFPQIFEEDTVGSTHSAFAHAKATVIHSKKADALNLDGVVTVETAPAISEIVYRLPEDADGDGWPDVDGSGDVVWSPVLRAFLVEPEPDGTNSLWRRDSNGVRRRIARNVQSIEFDDAATSGFTIPANTIRVRIHMLKSAHGPAANSKTYEALIRLPNGDLME